MPKNIHATLIKIKNKGVLFVGPSCSGKSDMALRFIAEHKAKLVADDRVDVTVKKGCAFGAAPKILSGKLEVRGIGIVNVFFSNKNKIDLVVELSSDKIERMPQSEQYDLEGVVLPKIRLNPFESSAPAKILAFLRLL